MYTSCISKKKLYKYVYSLHGIYNKTLIHLLKKKKLYENNFKKKFAALRFIFGPQQVFFQLFTKNSYMPDTHTTVGSIIRIRENIANHGSYKHIIDQTTEERNAEKLRTKKSSFWYKETYKVDSFLDICGYQKTIEVPKINEKKKKLMQVKSKIKMKRRRKKYKNLDENIALNKRGNIKTEPLINKYLRRRTSG